MAIPESARARFDLISAQAQDDPNILGFIITGSRGKGLVSEHSDYDLCLVIKDERAEEYKEKYGGFEGKGVDLSVMGLEEFRRYAAWGSEFAWDRYDFVHLKAKVDRLDGEIQRIIDEKAGVPKEHQAGVIWSSCDHYINQFYRAFKCSRDGDEAAAKLELSEGVGPLLDAMFALSRRVKPFYKYLKWELENWPLRDFPWEPARLHALLLDLSSRVNVETIKEVLTETERVFRAHGHGGVFDSWGDDLNLLRK